MRFKRKLCDLGTKSWSKIVSKLIEGENFEKECPKQNLPTFTMQKKNGKRYENLKSLLCVLIYTWKIEIMVIHSVSVVTEIWGHEVDGRKQIISKNLKNILIFRTSPDYHIPKQNFLNHSYIFCENTIKELSIDAYLVLSSSQTTVQIEGWKKYLRL